MAKAFSKSLFRIQYVSDLHLEHYDKLAFPLIVKPCARYLALAGDIGIPGTKIYKSFMNYVSSNWDRVFYIAGNNEYRQSEKKQWQVSTPRTFEETHLEIKNTLSKYKNITFLDHESPSAYLSKENAVIIGSTLWSLIPESQYSMAQASLPQYNHIPYREPKSGLLRALRPIDTNSWHRRDRYTLEAQIEYWKLASNAKLFVLTHHMPSFRLISPQYADYGFNHAYASSCDHLFDKRIAAWIYGHSHVSGSATLRNTQCVVNARGYPNQIVPGFMPNAWIEFDTDADEETSENYPELAAAAAGVKAPSGD
jgi:predicted phosphodiesterase